MKLVKASQSPGLEEPGIRLDCQRRINDISHICIMFSASIVQLFCNSCLMEWFNHLARFCAKNGAPDPASNRKRCFDIMLQIMLHKYFSLMETLLFLIWCFLGYQGLVWKKIAFLIQYFLGYWGSVWKKIAKCRLLEVCSGRFELSKKYFWPGKGGSIRFAQHLHSREAACDHPVLPSQWLSQQRPSLQLWPRQRWFKQRG